jgi:hypothetical protein
VRKGALERTGERRDRARLHGHHQPGERADTPVGNYIPVISSHRLTRLAEREATTEHKLLALLTVHSGHVVRATPVDIHSATCTANDAG